MTPSQTTTRWLHLIAHLFGGLFLANCGQRRRSVSERLCFPPGEGLSSSTVNVTWGLFNLAVAYALLGRVGHFEHRKWPHLRGRRC
jgi:hypothetical protein